MEKVRVVVDEKTLELTPLRRVAGVIYVQLCERSFPSQCWYDLCASILSMWLLCVKRFLLGLDEITKLYFMSGDYTLTLIRQRNQQPLMRLTEPNDVCVMESEIDIQYFARQILAASSKIANHFPQHQDIRNIQEITEQANALRNALQTVSLKKQMQSTS